MMNSATPHVSAPSPGAAFDMIAANVQQVVKGKPEVVRLAVAALLAQGHLLIEDVPGLGKTTLARSIAASVNGRFSRIQFTPDLLPGEITGGQILHRDPQTGSEGFTFHPGPIFGNIVMADEINRGTPKTQSALLEVMAEGSVTVDSERYLVPQPFMVFATQNPIELEGTYRLPEAQLDRFLMRIAVGYPDRDAEVNVVLHDSVGVRPEGLRPVLDIQQLDAIISVVRTIRVDPVLAGYAVDLAAATRRDERVSVGASPRGSIALVRAARGWAATWGRDFVTADDIRDVTHAVLDHRVILTPEAEFAKVTGASVVDKLLNDSAEYARTLAAAVGAR
ncbi:MoxR family ATPase [Actinokineospora sp. NBRC 105648]|uniref:AAA family ATPase n=1 Tax=Actinokineospora sp. NBRC 105648 TaxID=3032206 RepID=UPI0024A02F51|nr:MoxR family ATPase [Actinokineospora sp. NBRC 105648]GLZ40597.1 MoxR-like ATPase [Actinokineospora sp. NBRC 105648]